MRVDEELRSNVSTTVGATRTTPAPTRAPEQAQQQGTTPQTPADDQRVNPSEDMSVNPEKRMDFLVNEEKLRPLTPDERKELDTLQKQQKKNVGNVKKGNDGKESEADLKPISIEEGDIIKYMMKDIILASAGWAGGKLCGITGYYLVYKPLSWGYHKIVDKDKKGADITGTSEDKIDKKFKINDDDDRTTAFTKQVGRISQKQIEQIETEAPLNAANLQTLLNAAIDNKLDGPFKLKDPQTGEEKDYASLADALKAVPMTDPQQTTQMVLAFRQMAQNNPTKTSELKQQAQSTAQILMNHQAAQKIFEEQYASAMLIQNMQQNPQYLEKLGIQDPKNLTEAERERILEEKNLHRGNAKLLFAKMYTEYHRNPPSELTNSLREDYSSFSEFAGMAALALEHAQKTTEKGRYVEKGKNPEEKKNLLQQTRANPNEALDHLNELMGIKKADKSSNMQYATIQQAAQNMHEGRLTLEAENINNNIQALNAQLIANDEKRKRVQKTKAKAQGKSPYQEQQNQTSTINAIHNARSYGGAHV